MAGGTGKTIGEMIGGEMMIEEDERGPTHEGRTRALRGDTGKIIYVTIMCYLANIKFF